MDSKTTYTSGENWASAIEQMYSGPESAVKNIVQSLWAKDCAITIMGNKMTRDALLGYIKSIRDGHSAIRIRSERWVRDGNLFAEKHHATGYGNDGTVTEGEVWVMGELNSDGKAIMFEEIMRLISGNLDKELKA